MQEDSPHCSFAWWPHFFIRCEVRLNRVSLWPCHLNQSVDQVSGDLPSPQLQLWPQLSMLFIHLCLSFLSVQWRVREGKRLGQIRCSTAGHQDLCEPPANTYMLIFSQDNLQLSTVSTFGLGWQYLLLVLSYHSAPVSATDTLRLSLRNVWFLFSVLWSQEDPEHSWNKIVFFIFFLPNLWIGRGEEAEGIFIWRISIVQNFRNKSQESAKSCGFWERETEVCGRMRHFPL